MQDFTYSDELGCLSWIKQHPKSDPYTGASGIVREVAIDRWLNRLDEQGFLIVHRDDPASVSISTLGEKYLDHMNKWEEIKRTKEK